jgi:hypothetical protein
MNTFYEHFREMAENGGELLAMAMLVWRFS